MDSLIVTVINRPYVLAFLITFLVLGRLYFGWKRTILWLILGCFVAWASEFSSINTGFPYGWYHYIYENMPGEIMVAGVPIWDSISYPFMIFASTTTARFIFRLPPFGNGAKHPLSIALWSAGLTTLLDVITDPLAHLGEKWFLGKIYYYPNPGWYFDVPLSNFAGWFVVAFVVVVSFQLLDKKLFQENFSANFTGKWYRIAYPLFYISIALFNIVITLYIGHCWLALSSTLLLTPLLVAVLRRKI